MTTREPTRREQVTRELARLGRVAVGLQTRYQAHFALHNAACYADNPTEIQQRRDDLHTVLDALLDNGEAIQKLSIELETLP